MKKSDLIKHINVIFVNALILNTIADIIIAIIH